MGELQTDSRYYGTSPCCEVSSKYDKNGGDLGSQG